jgi:hypothetical protein
VIPLFIITVYFVLGGLTAGLWYAYEDNQRWSEGDWMVAGLVGAIWPVALACAIPAWIGVWINHKMNEFYKNREVRK